MRFSACTKDAKFSIKMKFPDGTWTEIVDSIDSPVTIERARKSAAAWNKYFEDREATTCASPSAVIPSE